MSTTSSTGSKQLGSVCVIGSGPAGFYTSKYLLKAHPTVEIDMLDRLPTPFGGYSEKQVLQEHGSMRVDDLKIQWLLLLVCVRVCVCVCVCESLG